MSTTAALRIDGWIVKGSAAAAAATEAAPKVAAAPRTAVEVAADALKNGKAMIQGAALAVESTLGGAIRNAAKAGIKGGIVAGIVQWAGESAIKSLFPLNREQQKAIDDNTVAHRLGQLWDWLKGPATVADHPTPTPSLSRSSASAKEVAAAAAAAEKAQWAANKDVLIEQAKRRQADMHPIIYGERDMEGARAAALSKLPFDDLAKKIQASAQEGARAGLSGGAAAAQPAVQTAMRAGTSSGVLAGLNAASGAARSIVAGWFAGAAPSMVPRAGSEDSHVHFPFEGGF